MAAYKIFLADLAHTYSVDDRSLTVPLGIGYLKTYAVAALGNQIDVNLFKHPQRFLDAVYSAKPNAIGFTNYGWNENLNREIGRYVRKLLPDALMVAGGPNIDDAPERRLEFLRRHDYLDFLVVDGGEESFAELVEWHLAGNGDLDRLPPNIVWQDGDTIRQTTARPLKKIIQNIPSPYLSGHLDEFIAAGMTPLFDTNRGCPFRCTFCAWGSASKDLVRRLDMDQALAEIEYVGARSGARNWIVCDANFGILPRDLDLARAIRKVKNTRGSPAVCHIWLAKNVTERNLQIAEIMGDMIQPVMAVQSLDDEVLKQIKRDNISLDTYEKYQQRFHKIGSRTYSDLIVPLPGETLASHLNALRALTRLGVDIIANHNMRLLAGAETNSQDTRDRFAFRTKYRLIHGDAGSYVAPDGTEIRAFEHEESLRSTSTMSEADLFYLRKLHFLVDFCWNIEVYKPLLTLGQLYGVNAVDVLLAVVDVAELRSFFSEFEKRSDEEWFDCAADIEGYFAQDDNWNRLINREFEKLNIQFSVIALRDHKAVFDAAFLRVLSEMKRVPEDVLYEAARITFALFPPLTDGPPEAPIAVSSNLIMLTGETINTFSLSPDRRPVHMREDVNRARLRGIIESTRTQTLSKTLNTQGISLRDLKLAVNDDFRFDRAFRRTAL
jgi:putative methyltransferase